MSSVHARPILIMAGGTGGHVFPALALARLLRAKSFEVVWLGTQRGLEARVVPAERIQIEWLSVGGLRGKGFTNLCLSHLAREVLEAFPGSFGRGVPARAIGNPVRQDISAIAPPASRFVDRSGGIRVPVSGGRPGAH